MKPEFSGLTIPFNCWRGCARVSEGCKNCYAEAMSRRNPAVLGVWGTEGTRPIAAPAYWREPRKWDEAAGDAGQRRRVFCGSLMDIWEDREDLLEPRQRALTLAATCQRLDWLFLSKRPQNIQKCLQSPWRVHSADSWWTLQARSPRPNWWFGCTTETQKRADERIPHLLSVPAVIRFLSCEPLLESIDLQPWLATGGIHWVIVGGESSQGGEVARHFDITWAEEVVNQCLAYRVPCFVKQFGSRPLADGLGMRLKDRHGGDAEEWPDWLRVRQTPVAR